MFTGLGEAPAEWSSSSFNFLSAGNGRDCPEPCRVQGTVHSAVMGTRCSTVKTAEEPHRSMVRPSADPVKLLSQMWETRSSTVFPAQMTSFSLH